MTISYIQIVKKIMKCNHLNYIFRLYIIFHCPEEHLLVIEYFPILTITP